MIKLVILYDTINKNNRLNNEIYKKQTRSNDYEDRREFF